MREGMLLISVLLNQKEHLNTEVGHRAVRRLGQASSGPLESYVLLHGCLFSIWEIVLHKTVYLANDG